VKSVVRENKDIILRKLKKIDEFNKKVIIEGVK
jgi:hypothetical protein